MDKKTIFGKATEHENNAKLQTICSCRLFGALANGLTTYIVRPLRTSSRSHLFVRSSRKNGAEYEVERESLSHASSIPSSALLSSRETYLARPALSRDPEQAVRQAVDLIYGAHDAAYTTRLMSLCGSIPIRHARYLSKPINIRVAQRTFLINIPRPHKALREALPNNSPPSNVCLSKFLVGLPAFATPIIDKTNPHGLVNRMFPVSLASTGVRYIATCFWSWLCVVDDLTEDDDSKSPLEECIAILSSCVYDPLPDTPSARRLMGALHDAVQTTSFTQPYPAVDAPVIRESWKAPFWHEVATVARALLAEKDLEGDAFSMTEWLRLRVATISVRPLLTLLRYSLAPPRVDLNCSPHNMDHLLLPAPLLNLPLILGLQNDLLGFEKDFIKKNPLSAVQLMIRDGWQPRVAYRRVMTVHNILVGSMIHDVRNAKRDLNEDEWLYVGVAASWGNAMAEWMIGCERYKIEG